MTDTRRHEAGIASTGQRWRVRPAPSPPKAPPKPPRRGLRTRAAMAAGRLAAGLSRSLGRGSGGIIGGRVALLLQPRLLENLAAGKQIVMITGTNGKTTTTEMVAEALRSRGSAVSNATGANMLDGHVAALLGDPQAPFASLEVDELHLSWVTERFEPAVIVLLNLSRDQLDRVGEIRTVEQNLRRALRRAPGALVVANRDDPNIVSAAFDHPAVRWISGGVRWKHDALNCPRCGAFLGEADEDWACSCGLHRPPADWTVTDEGLLGPDGQLQPLELSLPGQANRINAAFALAAALDLGCEQRRVVERVQRITQAEGRYGQVLLGGRPARLLLAKNPASWLEMLDLVAGGGNRLVLVVNSREADGHDVSWLWDIDFEVLRGRSVAVSGDRAWDLAVRLRYAGVDCTVHSTVDEALGGQDPGEARPDVIANYTAFRDLFARRERV